MKYAVLGGIMLVLYLLPLLSLSQDVSSAQAPEDRIIDLPSKFFNRINARTADLDKQLAVQTEKYLARMARQEARLKKKLSKVDSNAANNLFSGNIEQQYALRLQQLKADTGAKARQRAPSGDYLPNVDSLQTSLLFLKQHPNLLAGSKARAADIQSSLDKLQMTQAKLQDADQLSQLMQQRRQQIQQYLAHYTQLPDGVTNTFNGYKQQMFYYTQQVKEYKETLNDPDKLMTKALQYLDKVPAFNSFVSKNSMLASLFGLSGTFSGPGAGGAGVTTAGGAGTTAASTTLSSVPGMPSREQVMAAFQGQSGVPALNTSSVMQGNLSSATDQAAQLQDKMASYGNSSGGDLDMPDFTPNMQKTKSFFKRLELGANLQTVQSSNYFPATSDLALSLGYKLNDHNRAGISIGYKIGWGQDINHIHITSQGASLRSFADFRIKKSIYASGGVEYNYQQPFASLAHMPALHDWQPSALFGVSRITPLNTKLFKTVKMQLLWDALSYQQMPKAPPFKFRIGYGF